MHVVVMPTSSNPSQGVLPAVSDVGCIQVPHLVEGQSLNVQVVGFTLGAGVSDGNRDGLSASAAPLHAPKVNFQCPVCV